MRNKELLFSVTKKEFDIQTFRSGGRGGQRQDKVETGVRIIHKASGARGEARENRKQAINRKNAFNRLVGTKEFQKWLKVEIAKRTGEAQLLESRVKKIVEEQMKPENLKVEYL